MAQSLFSTSWYRVASVRPRLRGHAQIHRQRFRGQLWYVLQDHQTGRFHRLSPGANLMVCLMDGKRTLADIWERAAKRAGDDPPTQDETIRLLSQLHGADLIQGEIPPDIAEVAERSSTHARRSLLQRLRNPLALRMPLFDPDRALERVMPLARPLFSAAGLVAWVLLVGAACVLGALHWRELTSNGFDQLLTAQNVALAICTYPIIKALHELGHALATKVWGGEVHEVGVMLLVLVPAPYVDASSAAAFQSKWRRAVVGGAGIAVELALAAIATIVWVNAEPGLVRAIAFNVIVIGSVSTLLFNGNPLLRFDGYYILTDLIEIPNLGTRANRYVFYLVQRYGLGVEGLDSPATAPGEAKWFLVYAVGAFIYRAIVSITIASVIATQLFFVGILLALWTIAGLVVVPIAKGVAYLASSPRLHGRRRRAIGVTGLAVGGLLALLFAVPLPYATVSEGVIWVPEQAQLRARTEGVVAGYLTEPDRPAGPGQPLVALDDPIIGSRVEVQEAQLSELRLRYDAIRVQDRVQAEILQEQIRSAETSLGVLRQRRADLVVRAEGTGRFIAPAGADLPGRFVRRGDLIGYVLGTDDPVVRAVVPQADVDLVRSRTVGVAIRFAESLALVRPATVRREVPAAQNELPSLALSTQGGGTVAIDPGNQKKPQALQSLFLFDLDLSSGLPLNALGERVYVRFDHGREAVAWRVVRTVRQVFLSHLRV